MESGALRNTTRPNPPPEAMNPTVTAILAEVERATKKFPTWPTDPLHAIAVLGEEFGELTKNVLQYTYEPHKTNLEEIRTEAIQTAAMALRFAMSLETYRYARCEQHKQGVPIAHTSSEGDRFIGKSVDELVEEEGFEARHLIG